MNQNARELGLKRHKRKSEKKNLRLWTQQQQQQQHFIHTAYKETVLKLQR